MGFKRKKEAMKKAQFRCAGSGADEGTGLAVSSVRLPSDQRFDGKTRRADEYVSRMAATEKSGLDPFAPGH
jgi:hypothetical protein